MIELRPFQVADAPLLSSWIDGPESLMLWSGSGFTWPLDQGQLAAYAAEATATRRLWTAVEPPAGEPVGHATLTIFPANQLGRLARVLVAPGSRSRGIGAAMIEAVLHLAFDDLGLHRVHLSVFSHNDPAIRLYQRLGFQREGLLREILCINGRWWSSLEMGLLEDEWRIRTASGPARLRTSR